MIAQQIIELSPVENQRLREILANNPNSVIKIKYTTEGVNNYKLSITIDNKETKYIESYV